MGSIQPMSVFCVRLMQIEEGASRDPYCVLDMEKLIETRFDAAIELCKRMGLPSADTNAYQLVNSEGDRFSGLIVDVFGDIAGVASLGAWVEKYKLEIEFHVSRINDVNHVKRRPSIDILKEERSDISDPKDANPSPYTGRVRQFTVQGDGEWDMLLGIIGRTENSVLCISTRKLSPHIINFEKPKVLDVCCYTDGFAAFAFNAARGGATDVIG